MGLFERAEAIVKKLADEGKISAQEFSVLSDYFRRSGLTLRAKFLLEEENFDLRTDLAAAEKQLFELQKKEGRDKNG